MEVILKKLERFGISTINHSQSNLISHLKGTAEILQKWNCENYICMAGLCHSIYGTESFSTSPATLENRDFVQSLIGFEAERLAYLFGAHKKESLWSNLNTNCDLSIEDRFTNKILNLTNKDFSDLVTLTLANWLEQRPRSAPKYQFIRQEEYLRSVAYLPKIAFQDFLLAYGQNKICTKF